MGQRTLIMGIVNATPDSFSHDGCYRSSNTIKRAIQLAQRHVRNGADMLDIGGESTRPGSKRVPVQEELDRVIPVVRELVRKIKVPVSVDTYKPTVARAALDEGACIINDIMGTKPDIKLLKLVQNYGAALILMHIRGIPRTMQQNIHYDDLMSEIASSLRGSTEKCLEMGINSDRIILDPGIGFGKTVDHNLEILNRLEALTILGKPILIGPSRKSFIGKVLNRDIHQRLNGTMAAVTAGILRGAHIVRVHDVKAVKDTVMMADAIVNANQN